jgi:ferredoxin-NADP reductase
VHDLAGIGMTASMGSAHGEWLEVVVTGARRAGTDVLILDLERSSGGALPEYTPGSHIALRCGPGLVRHYSLCGPLRSPRFYRVGIKLERKSRGGTAWIRDRAKLGATLSISAPRNNFKLVQWASDYLFIAGGIGITPILPMLEQLRGKGRKARLVYMCRSSGESAFTDELANLAGFHDVHLHYDSVEGRFFDLRGELRSAGGETEVYCCGPAPLMAVVREEMAAAGHEERCRFEYFTSGDEAKSADRPAFVVVLASCGREIHVGREETMLAALRNAGVEVDSECEEGICGTCSVEVIEGTPEHRDHFLTAAEQAANGIVLSCVSRSRSARLVLDL